MHVDGADGRMKSKAQASEKVIILKDVKREEKVGGGEEG
jgi:hypothetical protein